MNFIGCYWIGEKYATNQGVVGAIPASRTKKKPVTSATGFFIFWLLCTWLFLSSWSDGSRFLQSAYCIAHTMNKAFTKETDLDEDDLVVTPVSITGKNYITPGGYERLRLELLELIDNKRPKIVDIVHWAASNGDRSENGDYIYGKKRLREIDRRIRFLTQRLEVAEITDPSVHHGKDQVFFGATVTYLDTAAIERQVTILGIDEADTLQGQISWVSPVARTLLKSRAGDEVNLVTPHGMQVLEVLRIDYPLPS